MSYQHHLEQQAEKNRSVAQIIIGVAIGLVNGYQSKLWNFDRSPSLETIKFLGNYAEGRNENEGLLGSDHAVVTEGTA